MGDLPQAKFTPGPWRVGPYYRHEVVSDHGVICCAPIETGQTQANARLIAAAPELYDELFRALAVINQPLAFDVDGVCADIQRVLKKAVSRFESLP
jgi:hypothetical protein